MSTYDSRVASLRIRLRTRMSPTAADGLLVAITRLVFGAFLLAWTRAVFVPVLSRLGRPAEWIARRLTPSPTAEEIYWIGIDLYKLLQTGVTLTTYCLAWTFCSPGKWGTVVALVVGTIAFVRLLEIVAAVGLLYFDRPSESARASFRPLANAFWSYCEAAVLFGILFSSLSVFDPDAVKSSSGETVTQTFIGPLYFSIITMTTVGYGDLAPQPGFARLLVIVEILFGLFLTIAILQKALARIPTVSRE